MPSSDPSPETRRELIFLSRNKCIACDAPTHLQIHHIDGDHGNNSLDNLALLCVSCHTEAETKSRSARQLKPDEIKHSRDRVYERTRRQALQTPPTRAQSGMSHLDALGVHEIRRLRHRVGNDTDKYLKCCGQIASYVEGYGARTTLEMLYLLSDVAHVARINHGPLEAISAISHTCVDIAYVALMQEGIDDDLKSEIYEEVAEIGFEFAYGSIRYERDWSQIYCGLDIICAIIQKGARKKDQILLGAGQTAFQRCVECVDKYDFPEAMQLLEFMRSDALGRNDVEYPRHIFDKIQFRGAG